jgi:cytochrome b involved in lipid metabolism
MKNSSQISQNGKLVEEKFIVEYKNEFYDVTEFLTKHPGAYRLPLKKLVS